MPKIVKLPSGNWRARVYDYTDESGKKVYKSITCDTKAEVSYQVEHFKKFERGKKINTEDMTVKQAVRRYIDLAVALAPSTLRGYETIYNHAFPHFMDCKVSELTDEKVQEAINKEIERCRKKDGKPLKPKYVVNEWDLISSALKSICKKEFTVRLPKVVKKLRRLKEPSDILNAFRGSDIELFVLLAMWCSLRLGEVRGLRCSSVVGDKIYIEQERQRINKVDIVLEFTKTEQSNRVIHAPQYVLDLIHQTETWQEYEKTGKDDFLIKMTEGQLKHRYDKIVKANNLDISYHDLRHYFASISLNKLQIPLKEVQRQGGWKDIATLMKIYNESFDSTHQEANDKRDEFFDDILNCAGDTKGDTNRQKPHE